MHIMDYVDAVTTGTLSPHILPIADLKQMLSHIEESLPTTMYLPVSSEDTLHFYRYLCTHVLIANRVFANYRCSYSGLDTTSINLQNFHLGHPSWKFYSTFWS